jgi:hypothetical protein
MVGRFFARRSHYATTPTRTSENEVTSLRAVRKVQDERCPAHLCRVLPPRARSLGRLRPAKCCAPAHGRFFALRSCHERSFAAIRSACASARVGARDQVRVCYGQFEMTERPCQRAGSSCVASVNVERRAAFQSRSLAQGSSSPSRGRRRRRFVTWLRYRLHDRLVWPALLRIGLPPRRAERPRAAGIYSGQSTNAI